MNITIDSSLCIQCGKCHTLCPALVFSRGQKKVDVSNPSSCIKCGHCVAICPTKAVLHSEFPYHCVKPIDYTKFPTPLQVMELLKARRSNRAFASNPIPKEDLEQVIQAGELAPTASNKQLVKTMVITDTKLLKEISDLTVAQFEKLQKLLTNPLLNPIFKMFMPENLRYIPTFKRLLEQQEKGNDQILRGATALILYYTPKECKFGCEDSNLAYQNASLMATSLGLAHFYTGFVCSANKRSAIIAKHLGIDGIIHAGLALANEKFRFENYIVRGTKE